MATGTCPKCNAALTTDLKVCPGCGATLEAPPAVPAAATASRSFGLGDLSVLAGAFLIGLTGLTYLIGYFEDSGKFSMTLLAVITLMLSPVIPLGVTFLSMKNPSLLNLNYFYAGFFWLMKWTGVSVMQAGRLTAFINAVDFWFLAGATLIAAGTCLVCCRPVKA
jgi:hypothetical protein